jgi:hypothetical protein
MTSKLFVVEKLEAWKEWKNGKLLWEIIEINQYSSTHDNR